jgi:uroporphyrinogen decarboxylase
MVNAREIVLRTLEYTSPERVARSFPADLLGGSDFCHVNSTTKTYATPWKYLGHGQWERFDEWGNTWGRIDANSKGEVKIGVLSDWEFLESYQFPDYTKSSDYDAVRKQRDAQPDKWLIGHLPGFTFNIARKMRKFEQYLMDLLLEPGQINLLHNRIDEIVEAMIINYAAAGVDSVMFPEDWGTQNNTLINPKLWTNMFYPRFQKLCSVAHTCGIKVFMHSCGQIEPIVPSLIKAGIDLLQFDQPDLHRIDVLAGHQENARISFWCPVDIQVTLQTCNKSIIQAKAREMLDKLWKGRGGFVAGYYSDNTSIGLDPKWQRYAIEAFVDYGKNITQTETPA